MTEQEATQSLKRRILKKMVKTLWVFAAIFFVGFPLYLLAVSANLGGLFGEMPSYSQLENPEQNLSSILYGANGEILGSYYRDNRNPVTYDELSPNLINALLATEDIRFENHSGIDLKSMFRAAFGVLTLRSRGGGSTVTQQLAKNLFDTRGLTSEQEGKLEGINKYLDALIYKTKEWILAVRLERSYTKKEIMAMYFNQVSFGSNAYGIKAAAKTYFNKEPHELNVQESAVLVGLQKAVTWFNPYRNPNNSKARRNVVMNQMVKYDFLTKEAYDTLKVPDIMLDYNVQDQNYGLAQYFREEVKKDLMRLGKDLGYDLFADGIKIYTTIDTKMQQYAERALDTAMHALQDKFYESLEGSLEPWIDDRGRVINDFIEERALPRTQRYRSLVKRFGADTDSIDYYLNKPVPMKVFSWQGEIDTVMSPIDSLKYYKHFLHSGFIAIDPHTGQIKAWVGGINYKYFKYDHVRLGKRQPGSLFKPFVYAAAVEQGYSPCHKFRDQAITIRVGPDDTWSPQNSDGKFSGKQMTIKHALATSTNSVSAQIIDIVKPANAVKMSNRLGIQSRLRPYHSMVLGTQDVSLFEIVSAYGTFVNEGTHIEPHYVTRIEDRFGNVIYNKVPQKKQGINKEHAYVMLNMLQGTVTEGSGRRLVYQYGLTKDGNEIGAKTGTTQNASDGWFVTVTKDLVTGAWVGGDDRAVHFRNWADGQGARTALPIVALFMDQVYKDSTLNVTPGPFPKPEQISMEIDCQKYENLFNTQDTTLTDSIAYDDDIY